MELSAAKLRAEEKRLTILLNYYKCSKEDKIFIAKVLKEIQGKLKSFDKNNKKNTH